MVPTGETRRFRYSDEVRTENTYLEESTTGYSTVGSPGGYEATSCWLGGNNGNPDGDFWMVSDPIDNVLGHYKLEWLLADDFGIPITVEEGYHTVRISSDGFTYARFKVYLLIEDLGFKIITIDRIDAPLEGGAGNMFDKKLRIKVGPIADINNTGELLSVLDIDA